MTVDIAQPKPRPRRTKRAAEVESLAIGEHDANIFDCPRCDRPLAAGTSRCPGCRLLLIARVPLGRALGFVAAGVLAGTLIGGLVGGGVVLATRPAVAAPSAAPIAGASAAPVTGAGASSIPLPSAALPPGAPLAAPAAVAALRQTAVLHQRIVTDAERLAAALAMSKPSSVDLARALRALSADAAFGARLAPEVARWDDAMAVSGQLDAFYAGITDAAKDGLAASLQNTTAYVSAGKAMLKAVDTLAPLDAASRALAATAGVDLPPVTLPGETP
jgi:hypothetical protein